MSFSLSLHPVVNAGETASFSDFMSYKARRLGRISDAQAGVVVISQNEGCYVRLNIAGTGFDGV